MGRLCPGDLLALLVLLVLLELLSLALSPNSFRDRIDDFPFKDAFAAKW
jgi:hypothetical protein